MVDDVSFEVGSGETAALLGPFRGGASTIGHNIAGLETADAGEVWLEGRRVAPPPATGRQASSSNTTRGSAPRARRTTSELGWSCGGPRAPSATRGSTRSGRSRAAGGSASAGRPGSRAASGSGWPWPPRPSRCGSTIPSGRWTRRSARSCGAGAAPGTTRSTPPRSSWLFGQSSPPPTGTWPGWRARAASARTSGTGSRSSPSTFRPRASAPRKSPPWRRASPSAPGPASTAGASPPPPKTWSASRDTPGRATSASWRRSSRAPPSSAAGDGWTSPPRWTAPPTRPPGWRSTR